MPDPEKIKLITGRSNPPLANQVAEDLGIALTPVDIRTFNDSEIFCRVLENVRGRDVFVIQSTSRPVNNNIMELLILVDALRRGSAERITVVLPYFGYARQDRKTESRTAISAKLIANMIVASGAGRVVTVDLHAGQLQGFFDLPTDNLFCSRVFIDDCKRRYPSDNDRLVCVSPDIGGVGRARYVARSLGVGLAIVDKRRDKPGVSEVVNIIGDVKGKACLLIDDIADSAGTLCNAADALVASGATSVDAYVSHGVFSAGAISNINKSCLTAVVTSNSILASAEVLGCRKIRQLSIAGLIAQAVSKIAEKQSVSSLFDAI